MNIHARKSKTLNVMTSVERGPWCIPLVSSYTVTKDGIFGNTPAAALLARLFRHAPETFLHFLFDLAGIVFGCLATPYQLLIVYQQFAKANKGAVMRGAIYWASVTGAIIRIFALPKEWLEVHLETYLAAIPHDSLRAT